MNTFDSWLLFIIILIPLIGAASLIFIPKEQKNWIQWIATTLGFITMVLSIYAFAAYSHDAGGFQFANSWVWLELPSNPLFGQQAIELNLGIDGISAPMIMLTGIVMFTGILASRSIQESHKEFFVLYFLLISGVFGVFASLDLFFLFFFYELSVLPMYLLIGIWGSSTDFKTFIRTKEYGAMKLMLYLVSGSVLIWISILAIFTESGLGTFAIPALAKVGFDTTFQLIVFPLVTLGFGILAGLWPFHTWSPDGHVAAPTAVSMVHAGVLMKLGAYGIIRVGLFLLPEGAEQWAPVLLGLGTVNVIYGALSALGQRDLKYVIGYSSVSHMGYVLMGIATLNVIGLSGAVLQMFSHGIMTALFFVVVGVIYERTHTRDIEVLEGIAKHMGWVAVLFLIAGLTSLGLPGLSGFVAELLVFIGLFQTYPIAGILGIIGAGITAIYILRLVAKVFFGKLNEKVWNSLLDNKFSKQPDSNYWERASSVVLAITILIVGLFPFPFMEVINTGVNEILASMAGSL
jgi:NADH-quinone oxidoreductase subunit M